VSLPFVFQFAHAVGRKEEEKEEEKEMEEKSEPCFVFVVGSSRSKTS
jgi:hypothetical protein